jgi:hypothetical protein
MVNKRKTKDKEFARLGIWKRADGDFEYIDPSEKNRSKYGSIKRYEKS